MLTEDDLLTMEIANNRGEITWQQVSYLLEEVKELREIVKKIGPNLLTDDE